MNYYGNVSQLNNAFAQEARSEYSVKKEEAKEEAEAQKEQVLGITNPLGEGSAMELLKTGIEKAVGKQGVSDAKKAILQKILEKINNGNVSEALADAKRQGVDFVKSKTTDLVDAGKKAAQTVKTSINDLRGKLPEYKVLKKNLRKGIRKDLEKFKGFEEEADSNPYSPKNFLKTLDNGSAKNDGDRLDARIRRLKTQKDLGLMSDDQEASFDKLSSKVSKLKELKIRPPADIDTISADPSNPPKIGIRGRGATLSQFRDQTLQTEVQPTMDKLNQQAQARLKLLNDNFGTEGSAGAGKTAADESQVVPTPAKPQQDPQYLKQVSKIKAEDSEGVDLGKAAARGAPLEEEGIEEAAEGDFNPVADVIGLGISIAGLFGGFSKHQHAIPKAPIPTQGAVQIGANQA